MTTETTTIYCDNCGEPQQKNALLHYQHLPYDVASSYKGESASVCADCDEALKEKKEKMETKKKWDTPSEAFMAEARLCHNLGDTKRAEAWERQAEMERAYERTLDQ